MGYSYSDWKVAGATCGWGSAPNNDDTAIQMFEKEPVWASYNPTHANTVMAKYFFTDKNGHFPNGFITKNLYFKGTANIKTPLKANIVQSSTQNYFVIKGMKWKSTSDYTYDVWLLGSGLSASDITSLSAAEATKTACCFYDYEKLINGFARIIVSHTTNKQVLQLFEGEFTKGV